MDIAGASIAMNQGKLQTAVSLQVMKMTMENSKDTATKMTEMLSTAAVDPNLGRILDVKV